jgi:hypothetical protein
MCCTGGSLAARSSSCLQGCKSAFRRVTLGTTTCDGLGESGHLTALSACWPELKTRSCAQAPSRLKMLLRGNSCSVTAP